MDQYAHNYLAEKKVERHFYQVIGMTTKSVSPEIILDAVEQTKPW